jgi:TetR/AcrR family transcriptional repressor of nem operon
LSRIARGRTEAARRRKALSTMSTLVGAMLLARAVDDEKLSEEILEAVKESVQA